MSNVSDIASTLVQRSGMTVAWTSTASLNRFQNAIQTDIAGLIGQINTVYYPLISSLVTDNVDVFDLGLSGNTLYSDVEATTGSGRYLYSADLNRKLSIKESIDALGTAIDSVAATTLATATTDWPGDTFLESLDAFQSSIDTQQANLVQLKVDTFGSEYSLNGDGIGILSYPLSQYVDALGVFFSGFPVTGNTYTSTFPTLTFSVPISSLTFDVTIAQSSITDLSTDLGSIRSFVGMATVSETPTYSDHGDITYVSDGQSLEEAIQVLDEQISSVVSDLLVTKNAFTDTSYYTLTTDGAAVTSSNILVLPQHSAGWLNIDWVTMYSDGGGTQRTAGGTLYALAYRTTGAVTVVDYSRSEMTDSAANAGELTIATAATVAAPKLITSGTVTGGVEFQLALTTGAGNPTKAVARIRYTTVTNTGP
jgi:hypothetical protein